MLTRTILAFAALCVLANAFIPRFASLKTAPHYRVGRSSTTKLVVMDPLNAPPLPQVRRSPPLILRLMCKQQEIGREQLSLEERRGLPPPFTLSDLKNAIPKHCWRKDSWKSMSYLFKDLGIVAGLAAIAITVNNPLVWPLYWLAQVNSCALAAPYTNSACREPCSGPCLWWDTTADTSLSRMISA
jgi:hypothetical protein